jgi:hypothetical protein
MEENKKTDNELIAEFMGDRDKILCDPKWMKGDDLTYLRYHVSWDWLMPVVEKIESKNLTLITIYGDATKIWVDDSEGNEMFATTMHGNKDNKIGHVYRAVAEFIKWHSPHTQAK